MITFSQFGNQGRLGNQLFQYASMLGLSKKYGCALSFPKWKYAPFFEGFAHPAFNQLTVDKRIEEPAFHYSPEFFSHYEHDMIHRTVDIKGWLQSEKYFEHCKALVKTNLSFTEALIKKVTPEDLHSKPTIAISIRRGDYVDNPNYHQLAVDYYITALLNNFPEWKTSNLVFFSDDMAYCRLHFSCLSNAFFADDYCSSDIEQLCLMSRCNHFIISNSTFSWWGAWLGEKKESKIVRPAYHFAGKLLAGSDARDYYPQRWTRYDHQGKKIDLTDVTFTVPVLFDHRDRKENVDLSICMIQKLFDTHFIVGEQGPVKRFEYLKEWCRYRHFEGMRLFHRTRMLNEMALMAATPIIVNWDADVIVPPMQIMLAADLIRGRVADVVYPYDGRFARMPRNVWFKKTEKHLDIGVVAGIQFKGLNANDRKSVGGAIFFKKEAFISGGMENEKMITYAPEDLERYCRFKTLGYNIAFIKGAIYHMDHYRGTNSTINNVHYQSNVQEYRRVKEMSLSHLKTYMESWPWLKTAAV